LTAKGEAKKVQSATFFTAQVDFEKAGDLLNFVDDAQIAMVESLATNGYLDGRYLAAAFNLLRGNDLIWSTVSKNYLLGEDYPAFDLLHWNGDVTNLPAKWHKSYLCDLYRDNKLSQPGALTALGVPIDLGQVKTPSFIQAGREDHISPAESVWRMRDLVTGPTTFLLAGSGHIAGVVNPPAAQKYQYWTNDAKGLKSLEDFIAGAQETKGSWWPHWLTWLTDQAPKTVPATGARVPGKGKRAALEPAPGSYDKTR
jgi:polyhydroxyalkanoate synthase